MHQSISNLNQLKIQKSADSRGCRKATREPAGSRDCEIRKVSFVKIR